MNSWFVSETFLVLRLVTPSFIITQTHRLFLFLLFAVSNTKWGFLSPIRTSGPELTLKRTKPDVHFVRRHNVPWLPPVLWRMEVKKLLQLSAACFIKCQAIGLSRRAAEKLGRQSAACRRGAAGTQLWRSFTGWSEYWDCWRSFWLFTLLFVKVDLLPTSLPATIRSPLITTPQQPTRFCSRPVSAADPLLQPLAGSMPRTVKTHGAAELINKQTGAWSIRRSVWREQRVWQPNQRIRTGSELELNRVRTNGSSQQSSLSEIWLFFVFWPFFLIIIYFYLQNCNFFLIILWLKFSRFFLVLKLKLSHFYIVCQNFLQI